VTSGIRPDADVVREGLVDAHRHALPVRHHTGGSQENVMSTVAKGRFTTSSTPHPPYDSADGAVLGRMSIDKVFEGDFTGTGHVEMLAARSSTHPTSAGYVAIERMVGTLLGKSGSFVMQHSGTMNRGVQTLSVSVVADTGTDALAGIAGTLHIDIVDKQHFYTFTFTLPDAP
jgi:hypothetical protein